MKPLALSALILLVGCSPICEGKAQAEKLAALEKRVAQLEKAMIQSKSQDEERQKKLKECVDRATTDYWAYIYRNGKIQKDGSVYAPLYTWEQARKNKEAQVQECQVLYGR